MSVASPTLPSGTVLPRERLGVNMLDKSLLKYLEADRTRPYRSALVTFIEDAKRFTAISDERTCFALRISAIILQSGVKSLSALKLDKPDLRRDRDAALRDVRKTLSSKGLRSGSATVCEVISILDELIENVGESKRPDSKK